MDRLLKKQKILKVNKDDAVVTNMYQNRVCICVYD